MKYDYMVKRSDADGISFHKQEECERILNEYGAQGWELSGIVHNTHRSGQYWMVFRRRAIKRTRKPSTEQIEMFEEGEY